MATINPDYSDLKKGTYVHTKDEKEYVSPVTNPNGNENLDESYRNIDDTDFRPEFSDLSNTFMFSGNGHEARNRFWGKQYSNDFSYRNSNADIEDPIFTGFTLSIDKLNSPLFYTIGEYDGAADGRLKNDGSAFSRNISDQIENCLKVNYSKFMRGAVNTYEIASLIVKDKFPDTDSEIGYGMQHNIYVDGLPYGATEYIYMVDKFLQLDKDGWNSAQDVNGHYSLGDGKEMYSAAATAANELGNVQSDISVLKGVIEQQKKAVTESEAEHNTNKTDLDNVENEIKSVQLERGTIIDNIRSLNITTTEGGKESFRKAVELKLQDQIKYISNYVWDLKPAGNSSTHTRANYDDICNQIAALDSTLQTEIMKYDGNPSAVQALLPSIDRANMEVKVCRISTVMPSDWGDYTNLPIEGETSTYDGSEAYKKGGKYRNITITVEVETKGAYSNMDMQIEEYKKRLEALDEKMKELLKKREAAKVKYETDAYTQHKTNLDTYQNDMVGLSQTLENLETDAMLEYSGTTPAAAEGQLHTGDVSAPIEDDATRQNEDKMKLPQPPQTVYDILGFIRGMTRLTTEYPYLMQTITGLDEAYKNNYVVKDSFRGSGDNKITINIYESIDLKVSGMFNKYFNAAYDAQYRRERLPVNLRRFNCSVFVHDIRNFHQMATAVGKAIRDTNNKTTVPKIVEVALNTMSAVEFKFFGCEIVPEETGSIFDNVTNADRGDMRMTNFTFTYSDCVINYLPFEDMKNKLLGSLGNNPHRPHVSVSRGRKKELKDLKYTDGTKPYDMKAKEFDSKKPTLNGLGNTYDGRDVKYDEEEIEYTGTLEGLNGHSTKPVAAGEVPTDITGRYNYKLKSNLGNVNKNSFELDEISGLGNVYPPDEKPENINTLHNVNDDDPFENTPVDDGSQNYEVVRHGNFDRSPLGNVNNDDVDEYFNLMENRDGAVASKDWYNQGLAEMGAFSSATENFVQSREEFERLFHHLASSVSASTGVPAGNVYEAYIDEIEHMIYPDHGTSLTGDISYNPSENTANNPINLGTAGLSGITSTTNNGMVSGIGNVNANDSMETLPVDNNTPVNINGLNTVLGQGNRIIELGDVLDDTTSGPIVGDLGDVMDDSVYGPAPTDLGDVLPDDEQLPPITDVGNVYPGVTEGPAPTDLGDVLPDDPNLPLVEDIENVYPNVGEGPAPVDLGDVLPDDPNNPLVNDLDNVYPNLDPTLTIEEIGDVLPDDPENPLIDDLDNVYPNLDTPGNITEIGDVLPDDNMGMRIENIGNVYPNLTPNENIEEIGDVLPDDNMGDKVTDIENVYPNLEPNGNTTGLGNVYPDTDNGNITEYIDDVMEDEEDLPDVTYLENIYPSTTQGGKVNYIEDLIPDEAPTLPLSELGNIYPKTVKPGTVDDLGDVTPDTTDNPEITGLGNVYPKTTANGKTNYLGDVQPDEPERDNVEEIDNVYPELGETPFVDEIGDVTPDETTPKKVKEIENVYPDVKDGRLIEELGDVQPDEKNMPLVKEMENVYPDLKSGEPIENIGDVTPDEELGDNIKEIENVYPDLDKNPIVKEIEDLIPDEKRNDPVLKLGSVYGKQDNNELTGYIGNVQDKPVQNPNVRNIMDVIPDVEANTNIREIGNFQPTDRLNGNTSEILNLYPKEQNKERTTEIGKLRVGEKSNPEIREIGNTYPKEDESFRLKYLEDVTTDEEERDKIEDLGKLKNKGNNGPIVEDLGKVK